MFTIMVATVFQKFMMNVALVFLFCFNIRSAPIFSVTVIRKIRFLVRMFCCMLKCACVNVCAWLYVWWVNERRDVRCECVCVVGGGENEKNLCRSKFRLPSSQSDPHNVNRVHHTLTIDFFLSSIFLLSSRPLPFSTFLTPSYTPPPVTPSSALDVGTVSGSHGSENECYTFSSYVNCFPIGQHNRPDV